MSGFQKVGTKATARMVRDFEEQRKWEVAAARAAAKAEEDKILSYNKAVEARNEGVAAIKQAKRDEEDRILKKIVEEAARKKAEEDEFNMLRDMLWEEELEAKRAGEQKARADKQTQVLLLPIGAADRVSISDTNPCLF